MGVHRDVTDGYFLACDSLHIVEKMIMNSGDDNGVIDCLAALGRLFGPGQHSCILPCIGMSSHESSKESLTSYWLVFDHQSPYASSGANPLASLGTARCLRL